MAHTATLTVTLSTNPATAHIGPYFADLRVNGRQKTKVGTAETLRDYINAVNVQADKAGVTLTVKDETYKKEFTNNGGLIGTPFYLGS